MDNTNPPPFVAGPPGRPRLRLFSLWTLIGFLIALVIGYLIEEGYLQFPFGQQQRTPTPMVAQPGGDIQVFFTTPWLVYPDIPQQRTPPPFEQQLIADIDGAKTRVSAATFDYTLMSIAEAFLRAHQRGVTVQLALDRENLEKPEMSRWAGRLEAAGIPIVWEETDAFLHSKFVIVDQDVVWTGSWNFSNNDTYRNNNNVLRIAVPAIVENYQAEFDQMAEGTFGRRKRTRSPNPVVQVGTVTVENYFAPQDGIAKHIIGKVSQAQQRIRFMAFSFTSDPIAEAMLERQAAGVQVQGVFESRNARGTGSEYERMKRAGADVWEDGNCYTMHHKVILVDDQVVITGSYNFSARAEDTNDENVVILSDPTISALFAEEFERVYEQARQPTRCAR